MRTVLALAGLWLALLVGAAPALAQAVLPVPQLSSRVIDQTGTLSEAQKAALETKLAAFEAEAGPQIALLLVATTAPEDIASYAQRVADTWKIGRRQVGDGLLLVVAKDERAVRIEVAKALEGAVPDLAARQIVDKAVVPAFRAGDYAGGLNAAVDALMARVRGEGLAAPAPRGQAQGGSLPFGQMGLVVFVGVLLAGGVLSLVLGRTAGSLLTAAAAGGAAWWLGAGLLVAAGAALGAVLIVGIIGVGNVLQLALMMMSNGRGGGGGGGGGGGFSSGGGGDFGGGGASGRW